MPAALDGPEPSLEAGELAWLATQDDVESRLVLTERKGGKTTYRVRHGPFEEGLLASLPRDSWTLLVHDVEKHLPDLRALFDAVNFIPDWRIDDLMVSFAAPGGGTGPHKDNYDVFLCQGDGTRDWRVGNEAECIEDAAAGDLSLVEPFDDDDPHAASRGDVLYLPPGVPHWGIARHACMTYSIGMRAPSLAELEAAAARLFDIEADEADDTSAADAAVFYEDPDLSIDEAVPGLISDSAIGRAKELLRDAASLDDTQIATILGSVATEPKSWLEPEPAAGDEADEFIDAIDESTELPVHGMARIAYSQTGGTALAFANGKAREVPADRLEPFRALCRDRGGRCAGFCANGDAGFLRWLLKNGVVDLTESSR